MLYVGAGLTIGVTVGPQNSEVEPDLSIQLCVHSEEFLKLLHAGLVATRKERVAMAKQDQRELQEFLACGDSSI